MNGRAKIDSITIEIHRLGPLGEEGTIQRGGQYIALAGDNEPASKREMPLSQEDFAGCLNRLRYPRDVPQEEIEQALRSLAEHADTFLPNIPEVESDRAIQIDLVMGAAELWAFPFEACRRGGAHLFADPNRCLILTRRIRQGFVGRRRDWPVRPRLLFVHAPSATDLPESLIQDHIQALEEALAPWSSKRDPQREGILQVQLALSKRDVEKAVERARDEDKRFTHIHVLAHGKPIKDRFTGSVRWGVRLGDENRDASGPEELAKVLSPDDQSAVVVTLATCDSGNQSHSAIPKRSFAQELHKRGVPIVLASQLPLTQPGSVTMTRSFYNRLLRGEDVRWALHKTRLDLCSDDDTAHDWVSLVGYVQLPEGYDDHLIEVGLKREMEMLIAARKELDNLLDNEPTVFELNSIEQKIHERIDSLQQRQQEIPPKRADLRDECQGILASALKRLAELLFRRAALVQTEAEREQDLSESRQNLEASLENYRATFRTNIHHHWSGIQQLALEAVLIGRIDQRTWETTQHAAELTVANKPDAAWYWAFGTLAELYLLAPLAEKDDMLPAAAEALENLKRYTKDDFGVSSTRDQLNRYLNWWTKDNEFFGDRDDLAADAAELLKSLY